MFPKLYTHSHIYVIIILLSTLCLLNSVIVSTINILLITVKQLKYHCFLFRHLNFVEKTLSIYFLWFYFIYTYKNNRTSYEKPFITLTRFLRKKIFFPQSKICSLFLYQIYFHTVRNRVNIPTIVTSAQWRSMWQRHHANLHRFHAVPTYSYYSLYLFYFFLFFLQKVKTSRTIRAQVIRLIKVYIVSIIVDGIAGLAIVLSYLRRDELFRDVGNIIEIKFYFFP